MTIVPRFLAVGLINTAVGGLIVMLGLLAGLGDYAANAAGYAVGLLFAYGMHRRWTFAITAPTNLAEAGRFALAVALSYLANFAILYLGRSAGFAGSPFVHAAAIVIYTCVFFLLSRNFVFVEGKTMDWAKIQSARTKFKDLHLHILALLTTVLAATFLYSQVSLNHDTSWFLIGTRWFLDGQRLYIDIVELNPPLAFYLTIPAIWISEATGLTDAAAFKFYVIAASCVSSLLISHILRHSKLDNHTQHALFLGSLIGLFVLPLGDFGQREHLMLIFALPYLFLILLGEQAPDMRATQRLAIGLVAALGLGLKPYFLLAPGLLILVGPIRSLPRRMLDSCNLGLGLGLIGYFGLIAIVHPVYLTEIVPIARLVYGSYGVSLMRVLLPRELLGLLVLAYLYLRFQPKTLLSQRLIAAAFGSYLAYLVQFKGWSYHLVPSSFFVILGALFLFVESKALQSRDYIVGILTVLALSFTLGSQFSRGPYVSQTLKHFSPFVDRPDKKIVILSSNVVASFPFVNEVHGRWSSRYPAQWFIPGAIVGKSKTDCSAAPADCNVYDSILAKTRRADIEDLLRYAPDLIYVDDRKYKSYLEGLPFDYIEFLKEDPRFPAIWSHYAYRGRAVDYQVWARTEVAVPLIPPSARPTTNPWPGDE